MEKIVFPATHPIDYIIIDGWEVTGTGESTREGEQREVLKRIQNKGGTAKTKGYLKVSMET